MGRTRAARAPLADVQNTTGAMSTPPDARKSAVKVSACAPKVAALLEELELEVDQRCTSLRAFADVMVAALRNELRVQLLKLPKKTRNMPMADFRDTFGAELTASLLADINSRIGVRAQAAAAEAPTVMRTTRKRARADGGLSEDAEPPTVLRTTRRSARAAAAATPAPAASRREATLAAANKAFAPSVPFTPAVRITQGSHGGMGMVAATPGGMLLTGARAPRNGEVFYSQNGSPLGEAAELAAPTPMAVGMGVGMMTVRRHGAVCATPMISSAGLPTPGPGVSVSAAAGEGEAASIVITTQDGREVCLDDDQQLTEEDKQVAFGRLQGLQNQMSLLMKRLLG